MRPRPASSLQKTYDECYLACSTAVYFEGQNNEDEALRSWKSALETINYHNARRLPSTYTPKSETERALQDSIRALETQCRERVELLEALRESRKESAEANGSKEPSTLKNWRLPYHIKRSPSSNHSPGYIGDGTIPAVGYTDLSKPAAIPGHRGAAKPTPDSQSLVDEAPVLEAPALRVESNSSDVNKSRGSSPERRKGMLTTLRNNEGKKNKTSSKRKDKKETRPAASKAAGLAWGSIYRTPSREKTHSEAMLASRQMVARDPGFRRDVEPRTSSGDEPVPSRKSTPRKTDSSADQIPAAHWREPQLPTASSRRSPKPSTSTSTPLSPRRPPLSAQGHHSFSPPSSSGQISMPDPKDFTRSSTSSPVPKPSVKPKPAGLRSSLAPPTKPTPAKSEGSSPSATPRQERNAHLPSSKSRTKSAPLAPPTRPPATKSPSSRTGASRHAAAHANSSLPSTKEEKSVRRKPPPPKRQETPPSSDPESWEQRSSSSDPDDEDEDDENTDVTKILSKLPKGIDLQSARQILNDIVVRGDEVHWEDIAGLDGAKKALKEAVVYPFLRPDLFSGLREPARGMLLFGPPGTGKTMLARAVATESKSTFFSVSASSLTSKWHGESEKLVRALFGLAKVLAPSIIFVDEIDSLLSTRSSSSEHEASRRSKTEFLIQWSDLQRAAAGREVSAREKKMGDASRVLVLAATNMPWDIDEAARRRFVRRQYIPLPEHHVREQQLRRLLSHQHHQLSDADIQTLVEKTEGFSGSDITALAKDAAMGPLRNLGEALLHTPMDQIRAIEVEDFEASLTSIRPSVSSTGLRQYEEWAREFGERGG
ncbi:AAA family ATPase [Penicillium ucsense]|uniref:AAA family ATPase n=1 Tax=Penicillium ucsense TaxID=2839758 RepID=A0A8J8WGH5_9EURO|nr:AAA family ATPase [Penicillium ucsense]KAF7738884.1 AAA family ATPase [Penicillium ucsense]